MNIRTKIISVVLLVSALGISAASVFVYQAINKVILDQKMTYAELMSAAIVHDLKFYYKEYTSAEIDAVMGKFMTYYRDIEYITYDVLDENARYGIRRDSVTRRSERPSAIDETLSAALYKAKPSLNRDIYSDVDILRSVTPVLQGSRIHGAVEIGLSIEDLDEILAHTLLSILGIALILFLLSSFILYIFLNKSIISPLLMLEKAANRISSGNYDTEVPIEAADEIGHLSQAFNTMTKTVRKQNRAITDRSIELEEEVKTRTRELEAFTASVSDDIKSPLRAIQGFGQLTLEYHSGKLSEEVRHNLEFMVNESTKMYEIINDLLVLSNVTKHEIRKTKFDLSSVVYQFTDNLIEQYSGSKFDIVVEPNIKAFADQKLCELLMQHLLANAFKYSSYNDHSTIEIGASLVNGRRVFYVKDDGVGFDSTEPRKLFEPFTRLHNDSFFEGSGIGLSIAEKIVSKHGGEIWAESIAGQGASFYFTLESR